MSTRSKLTLLASVVSALIVVPGVHYLQEEQLETIHQGPLKDVERRQKKGQAGPRPELNPVQQRRADEYEEQKRLYDKFSKNQEVSKLGKDN